MPILSTHIPTPTLPLSLHSTSVSSVCKIHCCLPWLLLLSRSVVSESLQLHGLQHVRFPCLFTISWSLLTHVHWLMMPSNHLILYHPLLLLVNILLIPPVFSSCLSPSLFLFSSGVAGSYSFMLNFLRKYQILFWSCCTILYIHQQNMRVLFSTQPHQHLL